MEYEINITELPSAQELKNLFAQTTWASKRENEDIRKLLQNLTVFVTIRENSRLIGFGRAIFDGVYRALLDDIIVDSAYQKRGLGKLIVETLLEQLNGIDSVFLNTSDDLVEFYKKFGFQEFSGLTMIKK